MRPLPAIVVLAVLLGVPAVAAAQEEELGHLIPPGYSPSQERDEQGLWMELEEIEDQVNKSALLVRDPVINNYVADIVCRVAAAYCNDFRVYVIRNPGFNASMTATGMMQVWTGLILRASSSDEIASVVGHEIAHYTRMHSLERFRALRRKMARSSFLDLGLGALTGVYGIAQLGAIIGYLRFNREQETEADLLGARLVAQAAYDPHATYRVWEKVIAEEKAAVAKSEEPDLFAQTHPDKEERMQYLKNWVEARFGQPDAEIVADQALLDVLNASYMTLMEDQLDTNRFGRTQEILERHAAIGVDPGLVRYFYGEMFRQRNEEGDLELAMDAYRHSIESGSPPPEAYKNLGYLHLKKKETAEAQDNFRTYLDINPDADDRAMIEFYLME